jgi:preprotein translocase subunit SecA
LGGPAGGDGRPALPPRPHAILPFAPEEEEYEEEEEEEPVGVSQDQRRAAQASVADFTRNIQRKKDKELAELQFAGGGTTSGTKQPVLAAKKAGRNDPCPCGSGKKYKKCCGA